MTADPTPPSVPQGADDETPAWAGVADRECGEHRPTTWRAWCFACSEWCYENAPCRGCELPSLRAEVERLRGLSDSRDDQAAALEPIVSDLVQAVTHYRFWFGDSCGCDDDPCPVAFADEIVAAASRGVGGDEMGRG